MTHITRLFSDGGSRSELDFGPCSYDNGFAQIDTDQDASWFGIWVNPFRMIIASYAEGDIVVERAEDAADFREALVKTVYNFHHPNKKYPHCMIDLGLSRRFEFLDTFASLGLASYTY